MLAQLQGIFPAFEHAWHEDEWPGMSRTYHGVINELTGYFPSAACSISEHQFQEFASWLNGSVLVGGDVENAVSTCFLEHSHQLKVYALLAPHLSVLAKARTHA